MEIDICSGKRILIEFFHRYRYGQLARMVLGKL